MPHGLIETCSILTTMNLVNRSHILCVIPLTVALRNAERGLVVILDYALEPKRPSYGSLVRRLLPLSIPAKQFLAQFQREAERGARSR